MDRPFLLLGTLGAAGLLGGAFFFQWLGWEPCAMCFWQRWPHGILAGLGAVLLILGWRSVPLLAIGALTAVVSAGLALYHTGVERAWWPGPASCTGSGDALAGVDGASLLPGAGEPEALVLCDEFTPFLFGLSMANWNFLASLALIALWTLAARRA